MCVYDQPASKPIRAWALWYVRAMPSMLAGSKRTELSIPEGCSSSWASRKDTWASSEKKESSGRTYLKQDKPQHERAKLEGCLVGRGPHFRTLARYKSRSVAPVVLGD